MIHRLLSPSWCPLTSPHIQSDSPYIYPIKEINESDSFFKEKILQKILCNSSVDDLKSLFFKYINERKIIFESIYDYMDVFYNIYDEDETFLNLINILIDRGVLIVEEIVKYRGHFITPCGVFKPESNNEAAFKTLLLKEITKEELESEMIKDGGTKDLNVFLFLKCLKNPQKILQDAFGKHNIIKIARNMNLVSTDKDKNLLIDIILLKLGFNIPFKLYGVNEPIKLIHSNLKKLESPLLKNEEKVGIMTNTYNILERTLKDLIYFYISILYEKNAIAIAEEMITYGIDPIEIVGIIVKEEFKIRKPIEKLTLGELIQLLNVIDKKNECIDIKKYIDNIQKNIAPYRIDLNHDTKKEEIPITTCKKVILELINIFEDMKKNNSYPHLIRIRQYITEEWGISYFVAIDEDGGTWLIKSDDDLVLGELYLMLCQEQSVALNPKIIHKYW